jgi:hypothetical protein
MSDNLHVLQTAHGQFITFEIAGENHLEAHEVEEYYNGDKFETEEEANTFEELLNIGKTSNPHIRKDWKVTIDRDLLPVKKRIMFAKLVDEYVEVEKEKF